MPGQTELLEEMYQAFLIGYKSEKPLNKIDTDRQKACLIKHKVYKNLTDLANCPVCGKAFCDRSQVIMRINEE